ncbi:MAG: helix-turn-helix transcriptional regulator [Cyanobacteria bacterium REEB67]|nr:helix-turn-helix transcriptional regulator [Cyanobacteria bacterium REEB67]
MAAVKENLLGTYLKDCRSRLDPAAFGYTLARRRTAGLRREEVAQRANVSATWYTWLEQGRGGAPSADVIDRIAAALVLTEVEREHVYMLALGRPPEVHYKAPASVSPLLQHFLDALDYIPAHVRTSTWDVIAWNRASTVLIDYGSLPQEQRNILRLMFCDPRMRKAQPNWDAVAAFAVAAFRADAARAGAAENVKALVEELCLVSPEFERLWRANDVRTAAHDGVKSIKHPTAGMIGFEFSTFAVEGRTDLSLVVYNPATAADIKVMRSLLSAAVQTG